MGLGTETYHPKQENKDWNLRYRVMLVWHDSRYDCDYDLYYHLKNISDKLTRPYDIYGVNTRRLHMQFKWARGWRGEIFVIAKSREDAANIANGIHNDELGYYPKFTPKHFLSYRYYCLSSKVITEGSGLTSEFMYAAQNVNMEQLKNKIDRMQK